MAALDLCVSCKGCKRDCPTGVDMARMKVEATAAYKQRHGHAARQADRHLPRYARFASALPWLFNLRDRPRCWRAGSETLAGFAAARSLPRWRSDTVPREAPRYGPARCRRRRWRRSKAWCCGSTPSTAT